MNIPEVLTKAADYIDEHGHHRGGFMHRGAVCARGAINAIVNGDPDACGEVDGEADLVTLTLADHLGLRTNRNADLDSGHLNPLNVLGRWNDDPDRTAEEVTAALRACAAELSGGA